jgi:antitoxin ParD1/3/4
MQEQGCDALLATIDIYCQDVLIAGIGGCQREYSILSSSLNVQLTDALRKYVDERASDKDVYATPSEYIRDLIRQDMQDRAVALNILEGLADLRQGRFSAKSILDFKDSD